MLKLWCARLEDHSHTLEWETQLQSIACCQLSWLPVRSYTCPQVDFMIWKFLACSQLKYSPNLDLNTGHDLTCGWNCHSLYLGKTHQEMNLTLCVCVTQPFKWKKCTKPYTQFILGHKILHIYIFTYPQLHQRTLETIMLNQTVTLALLFSEIWSLFLSLFISDVGRLNK